VELTKCGSDPKPLSSDGKQLPNGIESPLREEMVCWVVTHFGFCGGGDLFKLHSRASNGNVYSTLLFATAPAQ
jgi:hypothetical protein